MRGYSAIEAFGAAEQALRRFAEYTVRHYPDRVGYECDYVRCHEVARAVAARCGPMVKERGLSLEVVDGVYGLVDHSWILVRIVRGEGAAVIRSSAILDPYAVGRLPLVQLVYPLMGHLRLYVERPERTDVRQDVLDKLLAINARLGGCVGCYGLDHQFDCPENAPCL